jgi:structural maintenance of chromosome 2
VRSRLSQVDFNYTPQLGFDTRKVKDLVASLLALKPEDHGKSTALEIAAGCKCTTPSWRTNAWVRTSSSEVGSRSASLIPLNNNIRAFKISAEVCAAPIYSSVSED